MMRTRVCVCTSFSASTEPRAPRHAATIALMGNAYEVIFLDSIPRGHRRRTPQIFEQLPNITYKTLFYPHRRAGLPRLLVEKSRHYLSQRIFSAVGWLRASALSDRAASLASKLKDIPADVYIAYNIDMLLPAYQVAKARGAELVFDCMEFYSEMGEWQTDLERALIRNVERKCLPGCDLVLASSPQVATELTNVYGIRRPLALYNVPPLTEQLCSRKVDGFTLYWRNAVIDLGQRGLGDALAALRHLPDEISLHIQGRLPTDGGRALYRRIEELGVTHRVVVHPPFDPPQAVQEASRFTVGLCLERAGIRNHELTVSNKIFDYHMAGLAVVASDLPGLRGVVKRSKGGLLFGSGRPDDLARQVMALYEDREFLAQLSANARAFALSEGNLEFEMHKLESAIIPLAQSRK